MSKEQSFTPPQRPNSQQLEWAIATVEADREGDGIGQAANFLLLELIALRSETVACSSYFPNEIDDRCIRCGRPQDDHREPSTDKKGEQFLRVSEPRECPACWGNGYTLDRHDEKLPCSICAETGKVVPFVQAAVGALTTHSGNQQIPPSVVEPDAWLEIHEGSGEVLDATLIKPDGREPGLRYEPLYTAPQSATGAREGEYHECRTCGRQILVGVHRTTDSRRPTDG